MKQDLIEKIKVLLLFGKRNVDGEERDGQVEKILVEEDDTAHYFYMKDYLKDHFKDEDELQVTAREKHDVNSIFYEIQKLGHIACAENTSTPTYKTGIFYMPNEISDKQRESLKKLQKQLELEDYNITEFLNLHRDENGILLGNQKNGKASILEEFTEEQERQ